MSVLVIFVNLNVRNMDHSFGIKSYRTIPLYRYSNPAGRGINFYNAIHTLVHEYCVVKIETKPQKNLS